MDEGSSNGTFLNGNPITRAEVHKGDQIRVGRTQFEFNSFLQISLDQENGSPLTASPTKFKSNSHDLTKFNDQAENDTDSISPNLDVVEDEDSFDDLVASIESGKAEQKFVQIKNDLKFVYQVSLATSRNLNIHQMFHELMELIFDWIPADRGFVFMVNQRTGELETKYVKKRGSAKDTASDSDSGASIKAEVDKTIVDYVVEHRVAVLSPGIEPDRNTSVDLRETRPMADEVMCVPLQGHGKFLGVLYLDSIGSVAKSELRFNRDNLRMMMAMAQQAVVAIENASFFESQIEKERDSALEQVSAFMEHRVNNILQGIKGGGHLVEAGLDSKNLELCKKGWELTCNSQTKITELVGDLMVLSNPLQLDRKPFDLARLVVETANSEKTSLEEANLTCQLPSVGQPSVLVDQASMQTCLNYLFKLVIDSAIYQGTSVEFSISQHENELQLRVRHPGSPIRALKNATLNPKNACSIAFAIVQQIVQAHEGHVTIESLDQSVADSSSNPDWTSQATISLPLKN